MDIGLDLGFGSTKIDINGAIEIIQSAVSRPHEIGQAAAGLAIARGGQLVTIGSARYMVGQGSWIHGEPLGRSGLDYSSLASEPRRALFYAGLGKLLQPGAYSANIILGLPVPLLENEEQLDQVKKDLTAGYKCEHSFTVGRSDYSLVVNKVIILAQPVGAYLDWALTDTLQMRAGAREARVAILDIGMYTMHLYVVKDRQVEPRWTVGTELGVHRLIDRMNGHGHDLEEMDADLRAGKVKPAPAMLNAWLAEILGTIEQAWPDLRRFDAVIPVGGGALVLGDQLRQALAARKANVSWPADPVTANVRGLSKFAEWQWRRA